VLLETLNDLCWLIRLSFSAARFVHSLILQQLRCTLVTIPAEILKLRRYMELTVNQLALDWTLHRRRVQGRSQKFILGGYNFLLYDTTVLYTSSLTISAAISAQNNFQGLILRGYIYRYTPPVATPLAVLPAVCVASCRHSSRNSLKAKFHYAISFEPSSNQLRTS